MDQRLIHRGLGRDYNTRGRPYGAEARGGGERRSTGARRIIGRRPRVDLLMLTSLVVSRTGDWLRDVLDPTLRGE